MPVGSVAVDSIVSGRSPHTSCCACSGNRLSIQKWLSVTVYDQALPGQPRPSSVPTSRNVRRSSSEPPQRAGCRMPQRLAAMRSRSDSSVRRRAASVSGARSRSVGAIARARAIASSAVSRTRGPVGAGAREPSGAALVAIGELLSTTLEDRANLAPHVLPGRREQIIHRPGLVPPGERGHPGGLDLLGEALL